MPIIKWSDRFSIGDAALDQQHQAWLAIYNKAHDRMMAGDPEDLRNTGLDALNEMLAYGRFHFEKEEAYMAAVGYPALEAHRRIHLAFSRKVEAWIREMEQGVYVLNSEIIKEIENWLVHHILREDQKIRSFIESDQDQADQIYP